MEVVIRSVDEALLEKARAGLRPEKVTVRGKTKVFQAIRYKGKGAANERRVQAIKDWADSEPKHRVKPTEAKEGHKLPDGTNVRIYDTGAGKEADRYTAVLDSPEWNESTNPGMKEMLGFSGDPTHPQGFSQFGEGKEGSHLGKRIPFSSLPKDLQDHVVQRTQPESEDVVKKSGVKGRSGRKPGGGAKHWNDMRQLSIPEQHQLRIVTDNLRNPLKGKFLGGPTGDEAKEIYHKLTGRAWAEKSILSLDEAYEDLQKGRPEKVIRGKVEGMEKGIIFTLDQAYEDLQKEEKGLQKSKGPWKRGKKKSTAGSTIRGHFKRGAPADLKLKTSFLKRRAKRYS